MLGILGQSLVELIESFFALFDGVDETGHQGELSLEILVGSDFVEHLGKGTQVVVENGETYEVGNEGCGSFRLVCEDLLEHGGGMGEG